MPVTPKLAAAIDVFKQLGWDSADVAAAETLPLGTPEQRRVARAGLASGEWGEIGKIRKNTYGWIPWIDVDKTMLGLFAVRAGVDARRAARIMPPSRVVPDDLATRIVAQRGPAFAARFIEAACRSSRRTWEHAATFHAGVALRLVAVHGLDVPANVEYLKDWAVYAADALTEEGADRARGRRDNVEPRLIADRFAEHARVAVEAGVPATGPFGQVLVPAVERGWIEHGEAVELAFAALDAAQRPGDRKVWVQVLVGGLGVTNEEIVSRADALVPVLGFGDAPVIETLAPILIADVDDDTLADVLMAALPVKSHKAKRTVLAAASCRARPRDDVADVIGALIAPPATGSDRALARTVNRLAEAWKLDIERPAPEVVEVQGWWRPTPPVWQVPRFEIGEVSPRALTDSAAELTARPDGLVDLATERFLALANALAHKDETAARDALRGVRRRTWVPGLRSVPAWFAGEPGPVVDRPADPGHPWVRTVWSVTDAREAAVFQRLGTAPCLLSTPTWVDLRIDPADLVDRLREYAAARVAAGEADLLLAMTRLDPGLVTEEVLAALKSLKVRVVRQSGKKLKVTAGPAVRAYLADPVVEPAMSVRGRGRRWTPEPLRVPASLTPFPDRLTDGRGHTMRPDPAVFPTWGDGAGQDITRDESRADAGLVLRQRVRRATPLTPGLAVNMLAAQRGFHPKAAADGAIAVMEAWERGLLRPGVADIRYLDWAETPSELATFARACRELAEEGLASVVWPVLDDLLRVSAARPRLFAGTAELVETIAALLPEARAAVTAQVAPPTVLDLPGTRALATRTGSSRAVQLARDIVADLPEPVAPPLAAPGPESWPDFDEIWPVGAGDAPAVEDGTRITASWLNAAEPTRMLAVDITLPEPDGRQFRAVKGWTHDLECEGQCATVAFRNGLPLTDAERSRVGPDSYLRWDPQAGRIVVSEHRNWHDDKDGPLCSKAPRAPLTTAMVAVALAAACHDGATGYALASVIRQAHVGSAAVALAVRALLTQPDVSPTRMARPLEREPDTLPALWPVLTESIRYAGTLDGPLPRWLPRVLDAALLVAPTLREAARRGLIPADAAAWPGLAEIAGRAGKSATVRKAGELRDTLGIDR